ncbi:MAG: hypothetical protein ACRDP9_25180 [Kribbellaceae bacterium]
MGSDATLTDADELAMAKDRLAALAQTEGFALGGVFTECPHTAPAAFLALLEPMKRHESGAVVVPSLRHLASLGSPPTLERYLKRCTGVRVLTADDP